MRSRLFVKLCVIALLFSSLTFYSCAKEGCSDSAAINYDEEVKEDDGSCLYADAADMLVGTWNVSETVSGSTTNYSVSITKIDNETVSIASTLSNPPAYHMNPLTVTVDWENKLIKKEPTTVSGTITDGNNFFIDYIYGGSGIWSIEQTYTR